MYILKITGLTAQRDMQVLVRTLLRVPELGSDQVVAGLKAPPLIVMTTAREEQAQSMRSTLEKLGAICEIRDTEAVLQNPEVEKAVITNLKEAEKKFEWRFWLVISSVLAILVLSFFYFSGSDKNKPKQSNPKKTQSAQTSKSTGASGYAAPAPVPVPTPTPTGDSSDSENNPATTGKNKEDLKKELVKNPYNADAWKALSEKLEKEGDTASARSAKESYDKAAKAQMVLSSVAKAFGNDVRVEVKEDAVYYRTSKNFTESEFHYEASKLRDSLSAKFPGKRNLVIENYIPGKKVQRIVMEPVN